MRFCPFCLTEYADDARHCAEDQAPTVATRAEAEARTLLGRSIGGFTVQRTVARGGMGEVYEARHPIIARRVAVKVLGEETSANPAEVQRFFAEAQAVNLIRHPNIVEVLDLATLPDGRPYLLMEYLVGESLGARMRRAPPLSLEEIGAAVLPVLCALEAAHARGIVHRDLKPDNVFLSQTDDGPVTKVLDFGIAKRLGGDGAAARATSTGMVLGTPLYMAPEQAQGRPVDARTDVYALGAVLFQACCGRPPFEGNSAIEVVTMHVLQPAPAPRAIRADLPEPLEAVILRALAKEPELRWPSAAAMADALRDALVAAGVPAGALPEPSRRRAAAVPGAAALTQPPPARDAPEPTARPQVVPSLRSAPVRARVPLGAGIAGVALLVAAGVAWQILPGSGSEPSDEAPRPRSAPARTKPERAGGREEPPAESTSSRAAAATLPAPAAGGVSAVPATSLPHSAKPAKRGVPPRTGTAGTTAAPSLDVPLDPEDLVKRPKKKKRKGESARPSPSPGDGPM